MNIYHRMTLSVIVLFLNSCHREAFHAVAIFFFWFVIFFLIRFDSKPLDFFIQSDICLLFALISLVLLPALRFSLSKNRVCLTSHNPDFFLVRFAWLPCLVSYIWYSITQAARCLSGTAAAFEYIKAYRPASLKCASRVSAQPINSSLNISLRSALQSGQVCHMKPVLTALFGSDSLRLHQLRLFLSRLLVCAPQSVVRRGTNKTLRHAITAIPCGAHQTSSPVHLFDTIRASNPRAKAYKSSARHRRKIGIVSAFLIKLVRAFTLAGIHQLLLSSSVCGLLSLFGYHAFLFFMGFVVFFSCDFFSCSTPIKYLIKSLINLKANLPIRKLYLWFCSLSFSVCSLNPFFQPLKLANINVSRAICALSARFSLCRLLRCPFGNTPNKLLFVNSLKGCES